MVGISVNRPPHTKYLSKRVLHKFVFSRNNPPLPIPAVVLSVLRFALRRFC